LSGKVSVDINDYQNQGQSKDYQTVSFILKGHTC